jgi:hypothetical protein
MTACGSAGTPARLEASRLRCGRGNWQVGPLMPRCPASLYRRPGLSTYVISPHPEEPQYEVHIVGADGVRQTLLGFPTEADAKAWIAADQARDEPHPRHPPD